MPALPLEAPSAGYLLACSAHAYPALAYPAAAACALRLDAHRADTAQIHLGAAWASLLGHSLVCVCALAAAATAAT